MLTILRIFCQLKKFALTKSINDAYSCIHVNAIKARLDISIQNHEEKKTRIEATNFIHNDVVYKYLDDKIKLEKQESTSFRRHDASDAIMSFQFFRPFQTSAIFPKIKLPTIKENPKIVNRESLSKLVFPNVSETAYKNVNVMYRQGVEECFCNINFDLGMSLLHDAGYKDHLEAII
uniref:At2g35280-like TPR domain-containing protein n=1 Tax=Lactuca sativa TaxID=4236 RepID=A0A9R1XBJ1_LACSA|nr:hypothetical protein LSAT_V11C600332130 [Lactuca sativa]